VEHSRNIPQKHQPFFCCFLFLETIDFFFFVFTGKQQQTKRRGFCEKRCDKFTVFIFWITHGGFAFAEVFFDNPHNNIDDFRQVRIQQFTLFLVLRQLDAKKKKNHMGKKKITWEKEKNHMGKKKITWGKKKTEKKTQTMSQISRLSRGCCSSIKSLALISGYSATKEKAGRSSRPLAHCVSKS